MFSFNYHLIKWTIIFVVILFCALTCSCQNPPEILPPDDIICDGEDVILSCAFDSSVSAQFLNWYYHNISVETHLYTYDYTSDVGGPIEGSYWEDRATGYNNGSVYFVNLTLLDEATDPRIYYCTVFYPPNEASESFELEFHDDCKVNGGPNQLPVQLACVLQSCCIIATIIIVILVFNETVKPSVGLVIVGCIFVCEIIITLGCFITYDWDAKDSMTSTATAAIAVTTIAFVVTIVGFVVIFLRRESQGKSPTA